MWDLLNDKSVCIIYAFCRLIENVYKMSQNLAKILFIFYLYDNI